MKTFKDLMFKKHYYAKYYKGAKQATMNFENGFGVSVLIGSCFYSNGVDSYELAVLKNGHLCYDSGLTEDVFGRLSAREVTKIMKQVQQLKITP